jgi:hypothetical protein
MICMYIVNPAVIDRILTEQASAAAQLAAGHPDVRGLRQAATDWVMEEVLIRSEPAA